MIIIVKLMPAVRSEPISILTQNKFCNEKNAIVSTGYLRYCPIVCRYSQLLESARAKNLLWGIHLCLQRLGARFAGHVKPYDSLFERPWFYGGAKVRWTPKTRQLGAEGDQVENDHSTDREVP